MSQWGATRHDCAGSNWDVWDGTWDNSWYYANPKASVHEISTARQLAGLSQLVRDGVDNFHGRTIILTRDINLAGVEWRRIGLPGHSFEGSFNGGGHAIIGLSITSSSKQDGFFGDVNGGSVTNFAIKGSVQGDWEVGGVVGVMHAGHIVNVYSEVTMVNRRCQPRRYPLVRQQVIRRLQLGLCRRYHGSVHTRHHRVLRQLRAGLRRRRHTVCGRYRRYHHGRHHLCLLQRRLYLQQRRRSDRWHCRTEKRQRQGFLLYQYRQR